LVCFILNIVGHNLVLSILVDHWHLVNVLDEPLFWRELNVSIRDIEQKMLFNYNKKDLSNLLYAHYTDEQKPTTFLDDKIEAMEYRLTKDIKAVDERFLTLDDGVAKLTRDAPQMQAAITQDIKAVNERFLTLDHRVSKL
jgi:flagellar capping protein FliD